MDLTGWRVDGIIEDDGMEIIGVGGMGSVSTAFAVLRYQISWG